ncbi:MAG: glucosamine-6-phosphate deaminase [Cyanobacteria bacterium P01_A01_bin.114]
MTLLQVFDAEALTVEVYDTAAALAQAAAARVIEQLSQTLTAQAQATVLLATGNSQLGLLSHLRQQPQAIDWSKVTGFHLDEYLGLGASEPASFQYYLDQKIAQYLPFQAFHYLQGEALEPVAECERYEKLLRSQPLDLALLGIGQNGHLAFNDPAVAHFQEPRWVKLVKLDGQNRQQQVDGGAFATLSGVPQYAYTLTLSAISSVRSLLCLAFGESKARIVRQLLQGPITPECPASILRKHPQATLFLDAAAAREL